MRTDPRLRPFASGLKFPEGPRWHDGRLWLSDVHGHKVHSFDEHGASRLEAALDDRPSGLGFSREGKLLIVSMTQRQVLERRDDGGLGTWADLAAIPGDFVNDMVVDARGAAYVGNRAHPAADNKGNYPPSDCLILVRADGSIDVAADGLVTPNGAVIVDGGQRLVVAETRAGRLTAFSIDADGTLSNRHVFAQLVGEVPDGICLDAEGAVWVGSPLRGRFLRVREGGEITDRVLTGDRWAVAPALGGHDGRTLFLLTAHMTEAAFATLPTPRDDGKSPAEGFIQTMTVKVPGASVGNGGDGR